MTFDPRLQELMDNLERSVAEAQAAARRHRERRDGRFVRGPAAHAVWVDEVAEAAPWVGPDGGQLLYDEPPWTHVVFTAPTKPDLGSWSDQ